MSGARSWVLVSAIFLGLGLVAPTLTIYPKVGDLTWLVEVVSPKTLEPTTYSILGVIVKLMEGGDLFLGGVLGLFSVLFPVAKLGLYWVAAGFPEELRRSSGLLKWTHRVGKFSMAEVFALALVVVVVKTLPGGSTAAVEWGAFVFVSSVIGSVFASFALEQTASS